jgi:hypothetical protein
MKIHPPIMHRPDDEIDRLLRAFYRAELPSPWPELKLPALPAARPAVRRSLLPSRLALAASVLLLVLGSWLLADSFRGYPLRTVEPGTETGTARRLRFRDARPAAADTEPAAPAPTRRQPPEMDGFDQP